MIDNSKAPLLVLGFAGKRGVGKSSVSQIVAEKLSLKRVSFGDFVRFKAQELNIKDSIEELQNLGESLAKTPVLFCQELLNFSGWKQNEGLVIDGIRHVVIMDALKDIVKPLPFFLIFVQTNEEFRIERLKNRDSIVISSIKQLDRHSTENQLKTELPKIADLIVDNEQPIDKTSEKIIHWLKSQIISLAV